MPVDDGIRRAHVLVIGAGRLAAATRSALEASAIVRVSVVRDEIDDSPAAEAPFAPGKSFDLLLDVDIVVEASNHRATRYLGNDAAAVRGIPMVWGLVASDSGQVGVAWDEKGFDYRDVDSEFPPPPNTDERETGTPPGTIDAIARMITSEVLRLLNVPGAPTCGRVAAYDAKTGRISETVHRREPGAPRPGSLEERTAMPEEDPTRSITPSGLAAELDGPEPPRLLDVRQERETALVALPGATLIPLGELRDRLGELDPALPVVAYCHHGVRSERALVLLEGAGFGQARYLAGGIDAWSSEVDPGLARY